LSYPGGKNGSGVYQRIISQMPPHEVYIEPFLGAGAIMRLKRPAKLNIGIDLDSRALKIARAGITRATDNGRRPTAKSTIGPGRDPHGKDADTDLHGRNTDSAGGIGAPADVRSFFFKRDGIEFLSTYKFSGKELVYCDPPYVMETRTRELYRFELSDRDHRQLLRCCRSLPCMVMISGYWAELYDSLLKDWRTISFPAMTRGGTFRTEFLWMNFPEPVQLHDYRYLGENFRERDNIKRKKLRWTSRLRRMPTLERMALLSALQDVTIGGDAESRESAAKTD